MTAQNHAVPTGPWHQQAAAVLSRVRLVLIAVVTMLIISEERSGRLGAITGVEVALGAVALGAVAAAAMLGTATALVRRLRRPWSTFTRGLLLTITDLAVVLLGTALLPRHEPVLWVLLVVPLVGAGVLAGVPGTALAWAIGTGGLVALIELPVEPTELSALVARSGALLLVATPLGLLARGLLVATAASQVQHGIAAARGEQLAIVAEQATLLVHRDRRGVERATLGALDRLGAESVELWRRQPDEPTWQRHGRIGVVRTALPTPSCQAFSTDGEQVDVQRPDQRTLQVSFFAPIGSDQPGLLLRGTFPSDRPLDDDLVTAVILLGRHAVVALENARTVEELLAARDAMTTLARRDGLTGLPNRTVLLEELDRLVLDRDRAAHSALLFIDLDGFKAVNDELGHLIGDGVLIEAAGRLTAAVRPSDLVARLGGDEFCVLLTADDDPAHAGRTAARLIAALEEPLFHGARISASIGIAPLSPGLDADAVLEAADAQMYTAKRGGRGRWSAAAV